MSAHTSGPWKIGDVLGSSADINSQNWTGLASVVVQMAHMTERDPVGEANARLIAAAPDLLEALKGLDEAYCRASHDLTRDERMEDRRRLIAARAAIAKATQP